MSQSKTSGTAHGRNRRTIDTIVFSNEFGPICASGNFFGLRTKIMAKFCIFKKAESDSWMGLSLHFPFGKDQIANEQSGFGVCHRVAGSGNGVMTPLEQHIITIKFPRGGCCYTFDEAPKSVLNRFPNAKNKEKGFTIARVCLKDDAAFTIDGFGVPFANSDDAEVDGWVNDNKPIINGLTLLDILGQREFHIVVAVPIENAKDNLIESQLLPPFQYPYGTDQKWDVGKFKKLIAANKGQQFGPEYAYFDDNHHMTVVNQANLQDIMWLDDACIEIEKKKFPAYFVRPTGAATANMERFYVVVATPLGFREQWGAAWRRLSQRSGFLLHFYNAVEDEDLAAKWACKIVDHPNIISALAYHQTRDHELVLDVQCLSRGPTNYTLTVFGSRGEADRALGLGEKH
ncbi:hypothetical protein PT974_09876 [Cladobotryum mycophilum]|uniref:Uncharacterized protein n=1 Tax=Cladobotryum mycophilum TaxID=491253 RepID=A0ABR0SIE1_9HYPO